MDPKRRTLILALFVLTVVIGGVAVYVGIQLSQRPTTPQPVIAACVTGTVQCRTDNPGICPNTNPSDGNPVIAAMVGQLCGGGGAPSSTDWGNCTYFDACAPHVNETAANPAQVCTANYLDVSSQIIRVSSGEPANGSFIGCEANPSGVHTGRNCFCSENVAERSTFSGGDITCVVDAGDDSCAARVAAAASPTPTPSVTDSPTPTVTPSPTPIITVSITLTPTPSPTVTTSVTPTPTPTTTTTIVATPTPTPTLAPTATLTPTVTPIPSLTVVKTGEQTCVPPQNDSRVTYSVAITNPLTVATVVYVEDTLDVRVQSSWVQMASITFGGTYSGGKIIWDGVEIPASSSVTLNYEIIYPAEELGVGYSNSVVVLEGKGQVGSDTLTLTPFCTPGTALISDEADRILFAVLLIVIGFTMYRLGLHYELAALFTDNGDTRIGRIVRKMDEEDRQEFQKKTLGKSNKKRD
ncbi:MAG: hypothetical protein ACE5DX_04675 [Candidatus Dojkabacteria bacterium]